MDSNSNNFALSPVSFDEFNSQLQVAALKTTRNAVALPSDMGFHRSMDSGFSKDLDAFSSRILALTNNLLELVATADATRSVKGKGKSRLESQDDVVDNFHSFVVDSMDQLLERTVSLAITTPFGNRELIPTHRTFVWTNILGVPNPLPLLLTQTPLLLGRSV